MEAACPPFTAPVSRFSGTAGIHNSSTSMSCPDRAAWGMRVVRYPYSPLTSDDHVKMHNSPDNGLSNIWWVEAKIIEDLWPQELKRHEVSPSRIGTEGGL